MDCLRLFLAMTGAIALAAGSCNVHVQSSDAGAGGSAGAPGTGGSGSGGSAGAPGTGGSAGAPGTGGSGSGGSTGTGGAASCTPGGASTLAGVTIDFPPQNCTFTVAEAAAGITIDYQVVVAQDVMGVIADTQDAGGCGSPGMSGLILFEDLSGNGQHYCLCDIGLCPGPSGTPVTLPAGTYPGSFSWEGINWGGPSDTGQPFGPPFPPGSYTLEVSALGDVMDMNGTVPFSVTGTFPIHLVP
jgi:hypothetical protein